MIAQVSQEGVRGLLASYVGISVIVVTVVGFLKSAARKWVKGRELVLSLALTYVMGISAKIALPGIYGPAWSAESWVTHFVALLLSVALAKGIHDAGVNTLSGKNLQSKEDGR